jgi:LPXTG-site transpeptidase (sortase) family protein
MYDQDMSFLQFKVRSLLSTLSTKRRFISVFLLIIFSIWALLTLIPIGVVEAKYHYRKTLSEVFHVRDIRQLILPNFATLLDWRGQSEHQDYGITIPAIYIDEPVVFNVDPNDKNQYTQALKKGIAHASGTAFPDNPGLGYYFAHSSTPEFQNQLNAIFYLLGKLQPNDEIFIWHDSQRYEYKVSKTQITQPEDVGFLNETYSKETIVLQTCWPPGTTHQRLLVYAERVIE